LNSLIELITQFKFLRLISFWCENYVELQKNVVVLTMSLIKSFSVTSIFRFEFEFDKEIVQLLQYFVLFLFPFQLNEWMKKTASQ
jgi:hypothetical protein